MTNARRIVIVGGGPAGVGAALAARQQDAAADVLLISDEHCEPYEKPPLSKAVLTGKAMPHEAPIAGPKGVAGSGVTLKPGTRVTEIDRAARAVVTEAGEHVAYDALVLATGSINRVLPMFPSGQKGIHYLRTEAEALALKAELHQAKSLILIGGGVVGLEIAASAAELGVKVTVIEIAPRILSRVCDEETTAIIHERHRARGVDIRTGVAVTAMRALPGRPVRGRHDGRRYGRSRHDRGRRRRHSGRSAGEGGRPRHPGRHHRGRSRPDLRPGRSIAAGDCTRFPGPHGPVRIENWRHAQEHGAIAGRNAAGGDVAYNVAPSFWSEQFDMYIQGVGWPVPQPTNACAGRTGRARRCCSNSTVLTSPMRSASMRNATSPWRAA